MYASGTLWAYWYPSLYPSSLMRRVGAFLMCIGTCAAGLSRAASRAALSPRIDAFDLGAVAR